MKANAKHFVRDDLYLCKLYNDKVIRRCVSQAEFKAIINHCHDTTIGGHFGPCSTTKRVLNSEFYWPTLFKNAYKFVKACKKCQKAKDNITKRNERPQQPIIVYEVFNVWDIDFIGPFPC